MDAMTQLSAPVVVVDDDEPLRRALERLLRLHGFASRGFSSAEDFLDEAPAACCLILDIDLGGMSGIELYRVVAARPAAPPAVFVTGKGDPWIERTVREAGGVAYLTKPFDQAALIDAVRRACGLADCKG